MLPYERTRKTTVLDTRPPRSSSVLSREWLEIEGGVISRMFNALTRRVNAEGDYAMDEDNTKPAADATVLARFSTIGSIRSNWRCARKCAVSSKR